MTETTITETVWIEGLTLSAVIWKKFKRQPIGYIERVLELNPGLPLGETVPVGTNIIFPLENISSEQTTNDVVRLWD